MPGGTNFGGNNLTSWLSSLDEVRDSSEVTKISALGFDPGFSLFPDEDIVTMNRARQMGYNQDAMYEHDPNRYGTDEDAPLTCLDGV